MRGAACGMGAVGRDAAMDAGCAVSSTWSNILLLAVGAIVTLVVAALAVTMSHDDRRRR
jgi:hypothetical protein